MRLSTYLCMYCNVHMSYFEASALLEFQAFFDLFQLLSWLLQFKDTFSNPHDTYIPSSTVHMSYFEK